MSRKLAHYLGVAIASFSAGLLIGYLKDANIVFVTEEHLDTTDYTEWGEHGHVHDHDWRSGF